MEPECKLRNSPPDGGHPLSYSTFHEIVDHLKTVLEPQRELLVTERNRKLAKAEGQHAQLRDSEVKWLAYNTECAGLSEEWSVALEAVKAAVTRAAQLEEQVKTAQRTAAQYTRETKSHRILLDKTVEDLEQTDRRLVHFAVAIEGIASTLEGPLLAGRSEDSTPTGSADLAYPQSSSFPPLSSVTRTSSIVKSDSISVHNRPTRQNYAAWIAKDLGPTVLSPYIAPYKLTEDEVYHIKHSGDLGAQEWLRLSFVESPSSCILINDLWDMCVSFFGTTRDPGSRALGFMNDIMAVFPNSACTKAMHVNGAPMEIIAGLRRREMDDPAPR